MLATAFIISSAVQIALPVLSTPTAGAGTNELSRVQVAPACAAGVRTLAGAVDRAVAAAASATDRADAERRYASARSPEWDDVRRGELVQACTDDAHGGDAVAAVTRLDRAAAGAIRRQSDELGPVRRAVDSFIR